MVHYAGAGNVARCDSLASSSTETAAYEFEDGKGGVTSASGYFEMTLQNAGFTDCLDWCVRNRGCVFTSISDTYVGGRFCSFTKWCSVFRASDKALSASYE
jgi:hypothetical protein